MYVILQDEFLVSFHKPPKGMKNSDRTKKSYKNTEEFWGLKIKIHHKRFENGGYYNSYVLFKNKEEIIHIRRFD